MESVTEMMSFLQPPLLRLLHHHQPQVCIMAVNDAEETYLIRSSHIWNVACPSGYTTSPLAPTKCYKLYSVQVPYNHAERTCASEGAIVATPKSDDESQVLINLNSPYRWVRGQLMVLPRNLVFSSSIWIGVLRATWDISKYSCV